MNRVCSLVGLLLWCCISAGAAVASTHHRVSLRIEPRLGRITVVDEITFQQPTGRLSFALDPRLHVTGARGDGRPLPTERHGSTWRLDRAEGLRELVIEYSGVLPPQSATPGAPSFVDSEGSMLHGAWMPQPGGESFTYELELSVADGQVGVAPGTRSDEKRADGEYSVRFASERPAYELPVFAGPLRIAESMHRGIALRTYFYAEAASFSDLYLRRSAEWIDGYRERIGPYPFSHFYVVSGPAPVGYGFEGIAYLSRRIIPLPYVPQRSLGHEVLHCWWGNGVRLAPGAANWVEGLTTLQADYAAAEAAGERAAREMRLRWLREYAVLPRQRDFALRQFRGRAHTAGQAVGYHKAAYVFLMLRDRIGRNTFDRALRRFWNQHQYRTATWDDLRVAFEQASGDALSSFFAEWIDRTGAPELTLEEAVTRADGQGHRVSFTLAQKPAAYTLRVPVRIEATSGNRDEIVVAKGVRSRHSLSVDASPTRIRIDPDLRIFRRLAGGEIPAILREVAFDRQAATVIVGGQAYRQAAWNLAAALFDAPPRLVDAQRAASEGSLLVIGEPTAVDGIRAALGISLPSELDGGNARAWAARDDNGRAVVFVEGQPRALRAIQGPLPHYGGQSFVVFEGKRAVAKGLWRSGASPLDFRFADGTGKPATGSPQGSAEQATK